jgi:glutaminyl-peptide cyclotransferase
MGDLPPECAQVEEVKTPLRDGWGITTDGSSLIVSDGSHQLTWLDPSSMLQQRQVEVLDGTVRVHNVNEVRTVDVMVNKLAIIKK